MKKLSLKELGRTELSDLDSIKRIPLIVVLDNVRSGLNVGSIFRTCDAFAVEQIILTGITPLPPHREILKTALGSTESVSWTYEGSVSKCLETLKENGYTIIAIEQTNQSILLNEYNFNPEQKYVMVLGNEVDGVSEEAIGLVDVAIEIPQAGIKHSLNVSVCGGVVIWEAFKQLRKV